jgi:Transposase family tnp2
MISGPKQSGNDIDVFLASLIEELKSLWEKEARVWDAYQKEFFTLFVMLLWTINDFSAYGNLLGFKTKSARACPICQEDTCSIWLKKTKKTVYLGHRKFLSRLPKRRPHPYRKMTKEFNGKIKNDRAPVQILEKLKDKKVEFSKRKQKKSKEEK